MVNQKRSIKFFPHIPLNIREYREPFVGGGSVCLAVKQLFASQIRKYWINDLNFDLYCFWIFAKTEIDALADQVEQIKQKYTDGKELFRYFTREDLILSEFDRAVRFFVLNRITFSGTVDSGGYSQQAFERRFTDSSVERLRKLSVHLSSNTSPCARGIDITHGDYESLPQHKQRKRL